MAKRGRRAAAFSVESLRDEVDQEVAQQQIGQKIEADVAKLDLRFPEGLPENVVLWALLLKFGLAVVSSVAGIIKDLSVLPSNSRLQVFRIIYPTISDDDGAILFSCMRRISVLRGHCVLRVVTVCYSLLLYVTRCWDVLLCLRSCYCLLKPVSLRYRVLLVTVWLYFVMVLRRVTRNNLLLACT